MDFVTGERAALSDTLEDLGPEAPTMCDGWTTRDLAAHLVLRERRPDAAAGIAIPLLSGHTATVQRQIAGRPWLRLVRDVRTGPPRLSPFAIPAVNRIANEAELFVHHEDARRAQDGWTPRAPDPQRTDALVGNLRRMARVLYRSSPVGVTLAVTDGPTIQARTVPGRGVVTVSGPAEEIVLHASGRDSVARVELDGSDDDLAALRDSKRGM